MSDDDQQEPDKPEQDKTVVAVGDEVYGIREDGETWDLSDRDEFIDFISRDAEGSSADERRRCPYCPDEDEQDAPDAGADRYCGWCGCIAAGHDYCYLCRNGGSNSPGSRNMHRKRGSPSAFSLYQILREYDGSNVGLEPAAWMYKGLDGRDRAVIAEYRKAVSTGENDRPLFTGEQMARQEADIVDFIIGRLRDDGINISGGGEEKLMREVDEEFRTYDRLPEPGESAEQDHDEVDGQ